MNLIRVSNDLSNIILFRWKTLFMLQIVEGNQINETLLIQKLWKWKEKFKSFENAVTSSPADLTICFYPNLNDTEDLILYKCQFLILLDKAGSGKETKKKNFQKQLFYNLSNLLMANSNTTEEVNKAIVKVMDLLLQFVEKEEGGKTCFDFLQFLIFCSLNFNSNQRKILLTKLYPWYQRYDDMSDSNGSDLDFRPLNILLTQACDSNGEDFEILLIFLKDFSKNKEDLADFFNQKFNDDTSFIKHNGKKEFEERFDTRERLIIYLTCLELIKFESLLPQMINPIRLILPKWLKDPNWILSKLAHRLIFDKQNVSINAHDEVL